MSGVPAIHRAQQILQVLSGRTAPVSAAELSTLTGLPKSTLYLLLDALQQLRWIEKKSDGFLIGIGLYSMGASYLRHDSLQTTFRRAALQFVESQQEVVQLAVLDGAEVVYIAREDASRPVRLVSDLGSRLSAHACALGKALLAQLPDEELIRLLPEALVPVTERTITRRDALLSQLQQVRRSGLAVEREEVTSGLVCFAVFVGETPTGKRLAVSTSVPVDRLEPAREREICVDIAAVARELRQGCC
jgi:DNA-binding IclR family transcriptional regulator